MRGPLVTNDHFLQLLLDDCKQWHEVLPPGAHCTVQPPFRKQQQPDDPAKACLFADPSGHYFGGAVWMQTMNFVSCTTPTALLFSPPFSSAPYHALFHETHASSNPTG